MTIWLNRYFVKVGRNMGSDLFRLGSAGKAFVHPPFCQSMNYFPIRFLSDEYREIQRFRRECAGWPWDKMASCPTSKTAALNI